MKGTFSTICLSVLGLLAFGLSCVPVQNDMQTLYDPPPRATVSNADMEPPAASPERFQMADDTAPTTVESMMQLSEKYAALNDEAVTLRERNRALSVTVDEKQR